MIVEMGLTIRLICLSIPSWLLMVVLRLILICLGWVVVPVAVLCRAHKTYVTTSIYGEEREQTSFTWSWMWLWDNNEDGCAAGRQYRDMGSLGLQIIYWSCLRNPVNNLRFVPYLSCDIMPNRVRFIGSFGEWLGETYSAVLHAPESVRQYDTKVPQWFICWHGLYSCWYWSFVWRGQLRRLWIGWKIKPTDIYGVTTYRVEGAGYTSQFKVVR